MSLNPGIFKNVRPSPRPHALLFLLTSVAAILPLILRGPSCGHDFDFHLLSWIETATDWHHGLVYPHWLVSANYGAGEPRFIFYPPVSWFLGAALGGLASVVGGPHGWTAAPILLTFVAIFASGCAVYALARDFVSTTTATLAACLFIANPYLLFVAYERAAYAELLSTAFIALMLLFALRPKMAITPLSPSSPHCAPFSNGNGRRSGAPPSAAHWAPRSPASISSPPHGNRDGYKSNARSLKACASKTASSSNTPARLITT
jgi:hypothetical protein